MARRRPEPDEPQREDITETPPFLPAPEELTRVARRALAEDMTHEDVTSRAFVSPRAMAHAVVRANQDGVICGLPCVLAILRQANPRIVFTRLVKEGTEVAAGTDVCAMGGPARDVLAS